MTKRCVRSTALVVLIVLTDAAPALASGSEHLARTGRTIPFLAAGIAIGVALLLRVGATRLGDDDVESPADDRPDDGTPETTAVTDQ